MTYWTIALLIMTFLSMFQERMIKSDQYLDYSNFFLIAIIALFISGLIDVFKKRKIS